MNLKDKKNTNLIYDIFFKNIILSEKEKEYVFKEIEKFNYCNKEIKNSEAIINKVDVKIKYSSIITFMSSILSSVCLLFNNPLNLGLLALTITAGSLIIVLSFKNEQERQFMLIKALEKEKTTIEDKLTGFSKQKSNDLINQKIIINNNLKSKDSFISLSDLNEKDNRENELLNESVEIKRLVKHK